MNLQIKILLSLSYVIFLMIVMFAVSACSNSFTDDRDGRRYGMTQIGEQFWMAENLNYETASSFCPEGDSRNCSKYGRLYTWDEAKSLCPAGWRLPSREDFEKLLRTVNASSAALKATDGWFKKKNGTDDFGFAALPAGFKYPEGKFDGIGGYAHFWSSTEDSDVFAFYMLVEFANPEVALKPYDKNESKSVRCIRD